MGVKRKTPIKSAKLDLMGDYFLKAQRKNLWDLTSTAEILRDPWNLCEAELLHFCAHQVVLLVAGDDVDLTVFNHLASLHFLSSGHIGDG